MSNKRKIRRHPGSEMITVAYIDHDAWQAAGSPADTEGWLETLTYEQVDQTMRQVDVTLDEFLRRMAGNPAMARFATQTAAAGLFVYMIDVGSLHQWWDTAPGNA